MAATERDGSPRVPELAGGQLAARAEADELARKRGDLEDRAEELLAPVLRVLGEIEELDKRHIGLLARFGPVTRRPVRGTLDEWVDVRIKRARGEFVRDPHGGVPLSERDPLAKPSPGPPAE